MIVAFCVFVVLCLINVSMVSSIPTTKSCVEYNITAMQGFEKERWTGAWFISQLYDVPVNGNEYPGTSKFDCYAVLRTARPDGNIDYSLLAVNPGVVTEFTTNAVFYFNHPGEGRWQFVSADIPSYNGEYFIVNTDYVTYSIEIRCVDLSGGGSEVQFYIMTRVATVPILKEKTIDQYIKYLHLEKDKIRKMNILSCPAELIGGDGLLSGLLKLVTGLLGGVLGILG